MQQPKRVKFRKMQKGRMKGTAHAGTTLAFGEFGLQALENRWITANQIEAGRRAITRYVRRGGKIWIRVFPDKPITKKPAETRMGGGKGASDHWVAVVKAGRMLYEMGGVGEETAREAMRLAAHKMPVRTKFVKKETAPAAAVNTSQKAVEPSET